MCGIVGFFGNEIKDLENFDDILSNLDCRGPDSKGVWKDLDNKVLLGHTRLSVIDLSSNASQPMISSSGRFVITFNGEIYNFQQIKKKINQSCKNKFKWKSHSDTEVLCESLEKFGIENTLNMCDGMFAFAIYDKKEKNIYLARDQFGEKPLYYGYLSNYFFFSSDLSVLKKVKNFKPTINKNSVNLLLKYCYIPAPYSIYKNIYKLESGKYIKFNLEKPIEYKNNLNIISKYWINNLEKRNKENISLSKITSKVENLLEESIQSRMISDIPIGSFLSGGIDSSLVTALMQKNSISKVETFSIGQKDKRYNELNYAREVSKHLKTNHNELSVDDNDIIQTIEKIPYVYSEPFADSSQIPSIILSNYVKQKLSVALTGDGGDELFGGYNRYIYSNLYSNLFKFTPFYMRNLVGKFGQKIRPSTYDKVSSFAKSIGLNLISSGDKMHKIFDKLETIKDLDDFYLSLISEWSDKSNIFFTDKIDTFDCIVDYHKKLKDKKSPIANMMKSDVKFYLTDDILCKIDRAAMFHGLETRVPYLSRNIYNYSQEIPLKFKISKNKGKIILRNILEKYIPKKLINRPKMGFSIPIDIYLRTSLKDWANDLINSSNIYSEYFDKKVLNKYWDEHSSEKRNWQTKLWPILIFIFWKKQNDFL